MTRISLPRLSALSPTLKTIFCDISGILHNEETLIHPSHTRVMSLLQKRFNVLLVTNTTKRTPQNIIEMLCENLGYDGLGEEDILSSLDMVKLKMMQGRYLNPYVVVDERVEEWFQSDPMIQAKDSSAPHDAIVVATNPRLLTEEQTRYLVELAQQYQEEMLKNGAFAAREERRRDEEVLLTTRNGVELPNISTQIPLLLSTPLRGVTRTKMMERFFLQNNQIEMEDITENPLEPLFDYTHDVRICGKPSKAIWDEACRRTQSKPSEVLMLGDSVEADVMGALQMGIGAILVRTGKFDPAHEAIVRWMIEHEDHLVGIENDFGDAGRRILEHV